MTTALTRTKSILHGISCRRFFLLFLFCVLSGALFSQNTQRKLQPSATSTITVNEMLQREKQKAIDTARKFSLNDADEQLPFNLPVPPSLIIRPYQVSPGRDTDAKRAIAPKEKDGLDIPLFPALGDNNTTIPPDIGAAVGPNHLMIALNSQVRMQDKAGAILSTVTLDNFFSSLAGITGVFDPKVLYDPFAQRWIITAPSNRRSATSSICVGISANNDPTGTWHLTAFDADASNTNWFDYPSIGFNKNWIVITGNMFPNVGSGFAGSIIYMLDKPASYASPIATGTSVLQTGIGGTIVPAITLDNTANTMHMVSNWGTSGGSGVLRLFTITGTPAAPAFATTSFFPAAAPLWSNAPQNNFAPQSTVANRIANGDPRIQNAVFRGGSLWCTHTIFLPSATPTHSAVQWWQINPATGVVQQVGRVEDPGAANFYAFPSIAVNAYNDVLLGYSSFSATQFASANTSFRLHTDAAGTMRPTVQFRAGLAKYFKTFGGTDNRWGDYSSTCIDPDDFSLWTAQEYAEMPSGGSDRWGTEWNRVVPPVPDLFVKDRPEDPGAEPNPSTLPMWQSEDIWVRKLQDAAHAFEHLTENAEYRTGTANPNYVYVKVRNRGAVASAGTEQLMLYWAKASSGLSWTSPWSAGGYFDPGPNTMPDGEPIGTVTLPIIAPGGSYIAEFAWNPPNSDSYAPLFGGDQNHFCLLARVITAAPMTFPETTDLYGNVQKNNKIAWKNIGVYNLLPGTMEPAYATIANFTTEKMNVRLRFTAQDAEGKPVLMNKGTVKLTLNGKLKEIVLKNKVTGEGIKDEGNGVIRILTEGGYLDNIPLNPNEIGMLKMEFVPNNANDKFTGYAVTITQIDNTGGTEKIIGGQTAVFGKVKGYGTGSAKDKVDDGKDKTKFTFGLWWHWALIILIILLLLWLLLRKKK